ncbi:PR domain zinc finger protein 10-like isoform X2 [Episyrphus balteatus]|uniref:PR domain zinc finger protein 10-like isoform X2 n=1 Tax=Episyrphus balteatus TaxID=286459 RepID=UPI002485191F|nr:PR domain zinc finger protein 10-like isoform X2 [Episyrphus balteatus]
MSESIENTESQQNNYVYGGFQRVSSYDPNMCTTAARFSPFYDKTNVPHSNEENNPITYNENLPNVISHHNHHQNDDNVLRAAKILNHFVDASKVVDSSYLAYNNELPIETHQSANRPEVMVINEMPNSVPNDGTGGGVELDYIHGNDEETGEPIATSVVMHRSPNGHLYQNFYVTNEDGNPEEIVELIPIDPGDVTHLVDAAAAVEGDNYTLQPYDEFPNESHMDAIESHVEYEENQEQIISTDMLSREQQRILLESTMSPLLAAVNDITQRDKHFLSCLNQQSIDEEQHADNYAINTSAQKTDSSEDDDDDDDYNKTIESRARATLPTNYLYLGPINSDTNEPSVYAVKKILQRTKFGPFQGEIRFTNDIYLNILRSQEPRHYPLLLVGKSRILIVTNENTSNWMRFVRLAKTFAEQNLQIIEENDRIFFKCNRDIAPKEELRVGYHNAYAEKYNLPILSPSMEDTQKKYESDNPWMCFECDQRFPTSQEMQSHLKVHDLEDASCIISKRKIKRKRTKKFRKISELPKNSSRCLICFKVFMTNASLKKHFALHIAANKTAKTKPAKPAKQKRSTHKCPLCSKRFLSENKLKLHRRTHSNIDKPHKCPHCDQHCATPTALAAHVRSHTNRLYSCVFCQETFKYVVDFKKHVLRHKVDGFFVCFHCKKNYKEYHIVRRHIRIFHPALKYPCNECDRLFLHLSYLRRHKATHGKKKTIPCLECPQQFQKRSELNNHVKTFHKGKTKRKTKKSRIGKKEKSSEKNDDSENLKLTPSKKLKSSKTSPVKSPEVIAESYYHSQFKCEPCKLGFKRRGMLVNHLVKRHPEQNIDSIEELNQPIVKIQTMFKCPHCPKLYKNNAKRKGHILKNHPGLEIPASFRKKPVLIDPNVQTVGCIKTDIQKCHLCYKQYVSRLRLVTHYRKAHMNERIPEIKNENFSSQNLIEEPCMEPVMDIYRQPPVSPENKLLKLSSAALELSSIEDRKYFDFLNERSDTTDIVGGNRNSYKIIEENEFVESSSNVELNRLPELFEESIACI